MDMNATKSESERDFNFLYGLRSVVLDFENQVFKVNGVSINHCTDVNITFHNSTWSVSLGESVMFNARGEFKSKAVAQKRATTKTD